MIEPILLVFASSLAVVFVLELISIFKKFDILQKLADSIF